MPAIFDGKFREIFFSQAVSLVGGLVAGTLLAIYTNQILLIPGMLILLPGFLEMRGNISGTMAARLASGMFLGYINPKRMETKIIRGNVLASFFLAVLVSFVLGLVAFLFSVLVSGAFIPKLIAIPVIAGILANAIEIPLAIFVTFYLFRKGHDPNDIMGPFVTSTGDITSVVSLLAVVVLI